MLHLTTSYNNTHTDSVWLTSLRVMMLGCCPYLSRISTSSVGSLFALLMICNTDKRVLTNIEKQEVDTVTLQTPSMDAVLPSLRTPCWFLCVCSVYRWSTSRRRCPLWSRRHLRTGMCFGAVATHKDTNINIISVLITDINVLQCRFALLWVGVVWMCPIESFCWQLFIYSLQNNLKLTSTYWIFQELSSASCTLSVIYRLTHNPTGVTHQRSAVNEQTGRIMEMI